MMFLRVFIVTSGGLLPLCGGLNPAAEHYVDATNTFSMNLYKTLMDGKNNIFIAPFSVAMSLTMILIGARNKTAEEISDTLLSSNNLTQEEVLDACKNLTQEIKNLQEGFQIVVENAMWLQEGTSLLPEYKEVLVNIFNSEHHLVNFRLKYSTEKINKWVAVKTKDKVLNFFRKTLHPETKLAIVNAVYFQGKWLKQFDRAETETRPFYNLGTVKKLISTMKVVSEFPYVFSDHLSAQVLELHYQGRNISMVIVLPAPGVTLQCVESKMDYPILSNLLSNLSESSSEMEVFLPRFKTEMALELKEILYGLGIKDAFGQNADFSGITGKRDLHVSEAVQKSVIKVDEMGTEAASVTDTVMSLLSLPSTNLITFRADRPFLYIIKHNPTDSIFFMGRIMTL